MEVRRKTQSGDRRRGLRGCRSIRGRQVTAAATPLFFPSSPANTRRPYPALLRRLSVRQLCRQTGRTNLTLDPDDVLRYDQEYLALVKSWM